MVLWTAVGCVAPVAVFAYKFGLFNTNAPQYDSLGNLIATPTVTLNGWGIISCIVVGMFLIGVIQEIADAHIGYSLVKQCYIGISKIIPLIVIYLVCYFLNGAIGHLMFCLAVLIICKLIAVPLNPLPKWKYDKLGVEEYSDALKFLTNFAKTFKKGGA
jgi:hypothetical protein